MDEHHYQRNPNTTYSSEPNHSILYSQSDDTSDFKSQGKQQSLN